MKKISLILSSMAIAAVAVLSSCGNNSAVQKNETAAETTVETTVADPGYVRSGVYELKADELLDFTGIDHPVVVDFSATWCGPCNAFKPTFEKMAEKYNGKVEFIAVDVDRCPEVAKKFEAKAIPFVLFVAPDGTINSNVGLMEEAALEEAIQNLINAKK